MCGSPRGPGAWLGWCALGLALAGPAHAGVAVTSGLAPIHPTSPGSVVHGVIALMNSSDTSWTGTAYLADYATQIPDRILTPDPGSTTRSMTSWMVLDAPTVTVPPGEAIEVRYEIHVPDRTDLVGAYWALVVLEPVDFDTLAETAPSRATIRTRFRIGVRVTAEIGEGHPDVRFVQTRLDPASDEATLLVDLDNRGDTWHPVAVRVELFDHGGGSAGEFTTDPRSLYPGSSWRYRVPLPGVAPGDYTAVVVADGGANAVFGVRASLTLDP